MNWTNIVFCIAAIAATVAVSWAAFPYAALSQEELDIALTPVDAEMADSVDLGDFGEVPVFDMVLHYIDNPPLESEEDNQKVRFQGC